MEKLANTQAKKTTKAKLVEWAKQLGMMELSTKVLFSMTDHTESVSFPINTDLIFAVMETAGEVEDDESSKRCHIYEMKNGLAHGRYTGPNMM